MSLEAEFPRLNNLGYRITSPQSNYYNCIAWAARDLNRWWWPDPNQQYYWPEEALRQEVLEAFIQAFSLLGFVRCDNAELEPGIEKIAIYVDSNNKPKHAARQLVSGKWTSKLGRNVDIEHELDGLIGTEYGNVGCILKRPETELAYKVLK